MVKDQLEVNPLQLLSPKHVRLRTVALKKTGKLERVGSLNRSYPYGPFEQHTFLKKIFALSVKFGLCLPSSSFCCSAGLLELS